LAVKKLKPTYLIDLATLTGAMVIALGDEMTGMLCNDDELSDELFKAGQRTHENVWRLPLYEDYKSDLKSDIADLKSTGGRAGSSIKAALFLQEFVGEKVSWAHLDIAGPAYLSKGHGYTPKNGTGVGVRLLVDFLQSRS
jgi:leucyl aminopeptidase